MCVTRERPGEARPDPVTKQGNWILDTWRPARARLGRVVPVLRSHGHERAAASADSIAGGARPPSERRPLRVDEKGKRPVCVGGPFGRPGLQLVRRIGARLDCGTAGTLATDALDAADVVTNRRAAAVMMAQCAGASSERSASCEHWGAASASEMQMSRRAQRQNDARSMPSRGSWAAE